jgi:DNA-binding MarR family transcriptional regulator
MKLIEILEATPFPVGYRLAFLTNFYREPLLRRMEREAGLIRPELTVLMCLNFRGDLNARDICEITEQPSNTVSRAIASLLAKGMISRHPDHDDGRRKRLFLEPEGKRVHDRVIALFEQAEAHLTACLDDGERAALTDMLGRMARDVPRWQKLAPYKEVVADE